MATGVTVSAAQDSGAAEPAGSHGATRAHRATPHAFELGDMDRLWEVIDQLTSGSDPSLDQWTTLASSPGYASLIKEEIPKSVLMASLRVAFLPSNHTQMQQWSDQDTPALHLAEHFIELNSKRQAVTHFLSQLSHEHIALSQRAIELACSYFAHPAPEQGPRFTVAFAAFQRDARGYRDSIVIDPLFALEAGDSLVYWLAHETHHLLRHPLAVATAPGARAGGDQLLAWVLHQLQSEGIADQIDKPHIFLDDGYLAHSRVAQFFRDEVANAPKRITQLDTLMRELADGRLDGDSVGERIRDTAKMAGIIERTLGRSALLDDIGNPVRFLATYNRAAHQAAQDLPVFSNVSLAYTSRLFVEP